MGRYFLDLFFVDVCSVVIALWPCKGGLGVRLTALLLLLAEVCVFRLVMFVAVWDGSTRLVKMKPYFVL